MGFCLRELSTCVQGGFEDIQISGLLSFVVVRLCGWQQIEGTSLHLQDLSPPTSYTLSLLSDDPAVSDHSDVLFLVPQSSK